MYKYDCCIYCLSQNNALLNGNNNASHIWVRAADNKEVRKMHFEQAAP